MSYQCGASRERLIRCIRHEYFINTFCVEIVDDVDEVPLYR